MRAKPHRARGDVIVFCVAILLAAGTIAGAAAVRRPALVAIDIMFIAAASDALNGNRVVTNIDQVNTVVRQLLQDIINGLP